jgi:ParB-like chromosome segregation protein Spo0J
MTELSSGDTGRNSELKFHPLADMFPLIEGAEFAELVTDIKASGLVEPIVVLDGMILDGRNRYRACIEAGVEPTYRPFTRDDPAAHVTSANIHRRHLNAEQKRDLITALLKATPEKSDRQIAKVARVDYKTVGTARADLEATGEIPRLNNTVGADGKERKRTTRKTDRKPLPDCHGAEDDPGDDDETVWRRGLVYRAEQAAGHAAFEDWSAFAVDDELVQLVEQAAAAWNKTAAYLNRLQAEQRPASTPDDGLDIPDYLRRSAS